MSENFQIIELEIDTKILNKIDNRFRNQIVGCMHAHNELVVLNRLLMFGMNFKDDNELVRSAYTVQMWTILQVLAGKIVETWGMLTVRFLNSNPEDIFIKKLIPEHTASLDWLKNYFGFPKRKENALKFIRDKTAFHYDKLNIADAVINLAEKENHIYLAQHPANGLYYVGSALVFRSAFTLIAQADGFAGNSQNELVTHGVKVAVGDASAANYHLHLVLYGLLHGLLEDAIGRPLETLEQTLINVHNASDPEKIDLPVFVDIGSA